MKYKVLVVDDDPNVLWNVRLFLKDEYDVFVVNSGEAALHFFEKKTVDLILLDVFMPGMGGHETMERLRDWNDTAQIPVIFLTGDKDSQCEITSFELGAADFLIKPLEMGVLRQRVAYHIQTRQSQAQLQGMLEEEKQKEQEFKKKIVLDVLTGLLNKMAFQEKVTRCLESHVPGALMILDVDDFKVINDTYGHLEGDRILVQLTGVLKECIREDSLIGRFGGDEFAAYLPGVTKREDVAQRANEIISKIRKNLVLPDGPHKVSVSIGVALFPEQAEIYDILFERADGALLHTKEHGKAGYRLFSDEDGFVEEGRGRVDFTHESLTTLLRRRKGEQYREWVRFGEFRLLWHSAMQIADFYHVQVAAVLLTINPNEGVQMEQNQAERIRASIHRYFTQAEGRSILAWYSVNQLLVLLNWQEDAQRMIHRFEKAMSGDSIMECVEITHEVLLAGLDEKGKEATR